MLLVEDDESQRITLSMALKGRGFDVDAVDGWKEALRRVETISYDGIVLDIKMPVIDGIELAKRIKKLKPKSKIILTSGFKTSDEIKGLDVDIDAFFEKPFDVAKLAACLNNIAN